MKNLGKYFIGFVYLVAAIAGIWALILQLQGESYTLDIKTIGIENLTTNTVEEKDFSAIYTFKGLTVDNLWRIGVLIENISDVSIIGEGAQKRIIGTNLKGNVSEGYSLLGFESKNANFPISLELDENKELKFSFTQWKPNESIELIMYVEGDNSRIGNLPSFVISDRQFLDGKTSYSNLSNSNSEKYLHEYFPSYIIQIIKWSIIFIFLMLSLFIFGTSLFQLIKIIKLKKWTIQNKNHLVTQTQKMISKGILVNHENLSDLPDNYWFEFPVEKPEIPEFSKNTILSFSTMLIFLFYLLTPLLWLIKI